MIFTETPLRGAFVIEPEPLEDERGLFVRTWCRRELQARGLETQIVQCSTSLSVKKGTLRGMHYQVAPYGETKPGVSKGARNSSRFGRTILTARLLPFDAER